MSMTVPPGATRDQVVAACRQACACSDEIGRGLPRSVHGGRDRQSRPTHPVSLRRIVTHMIEETARHAGHADILREQIDGAAGL